MAATMILGPQQPALMYVGFFAVALAGVTQGVFPWLNRPAVMPSVARLGAAAALGGCAGILTWAAVQMPFIGLLSGFLVFTAAPMWFAAMSHGWSALFTTIRGIFEATIAVWFGVLTGFLITTTGGAVPGAVLAGILAAAAILMELTAELTRSAELASMPRR
jgi:hypothetical protein